MRESDLTGDPAGRRLIELSPEIDGWHARLDLPNSGPAPHSALIADDHASSPLQISHAAWLAVSQAIDNLHAFREATLSGGPDHFRVVTRPYGAYPNLRAALENAAVVLWMLGPANRNARLLRRFRLYLADGKHKDEIEKLLGIIPQSNYDERLRHVTRLAQARRIDPKALKHLPRYAEIVRDAGPHAGFKPDGAEAMWRVLSGMTHGDLWATFGLAEKERLIETAPGVFSTRVTSSVDSVVALCHVAALFVREAVAMIDRRSASLLSV